jgi:RNA polymerase sporulation-specific sigma factor
MKNTALAPALPDAENTELLIRTLNGDVEAKATFIEHNTRFIMYVAHKFDNTGLDLDDLFQIAVIGFLKSIQHFDISKGVRFQTFSTKCMENEILMFLRQNKKHVGLMSFESTVFFTDTDGNDDLMVQDMIGTEDRASLDMLEVDAMRYAFQKLQESGKLSARDAYVLKLRYEDELIQAEVAEIVGVSQSFVSRIEKAAIENLRKLMSR